MMVGWRHTIEVTKNPIGFSPPSKTTKALARKLIGCARCVTGELILGSVDTNGSGKKQLLIL